MANNDIVDAKSADDARMAASMPRPTIPEGFSEGDFYTPNLPVVPFSLRRIEDGAEFGPFAPEGWVTDPETGITVTHGEDHHPFVLRVTNETYKSNLYMLNVVEEDGRRCTYLVHEIPDNTLEDPEPPAAGPTHQEDEF